MHVASIVDLEINTNTMHQHVAGPTVLQTMMCMLSDEVDRGAKSVYPDEIEARVFFQKDVTIEYIDTIRGYQSWN